MSTVKTLQIASDDSKQTEQLGESLGQRLKGGEAIELVSDLGGGKTTFVRGLAKGAGSKDVVASPTFTISKIYKSPNTEITHFDFYRLPEAGLVAHELHDALNDPKTTVVVEWANVVKDVLPDSRLTIVFEPTSETGRKITVNYPSELNYLVEGLN